jgi:hypothetical protein
MTIQLPLLSAIIRGKIDDHNIAMSFAAPFGFANINREQFLSLLGRAIKLDARNCVNLVRLAPALDRETYPQCTPPWKHTWLEWQNPLPGWVERFAGTPEGWGVAPTAGCTAALVSVVDSDDPNVYACIGIKFYCFVGGHVVSVGAGLHVVLEIDAEGCILSACCGAPGLHNLDASSAGFFSESCHVPLVAFCLANCKNVIAQECQGHCKLDGYVGRKKKRKHFYRYHVLKIGGDYSGKASEPGDGHADRAMHICRGHFAKYTDDAPLFGRYTGLFWKPMHVRGNVRNGIVDKDYKLGR